MIKHIGKHNNRKVVILYRQVPNETHMCLVTYTDSLPSALHDDLMRVLESPAGQAAKELSDALFRNLTTEGRPLLTTLHREGRIKKVPTNQVMVTPAANSVVKLDELNKILIEMEKGEEAIARLKELEDSMGMVDPRTRNKKDKKTTASTVSPPLAAPADGALSDNELAASLRQQAEKMTLEAKALMTEAERLHKEAAALVPAEQEKETPMVAADVTTTKPKTKKATKVKTN